MRRQLLRLTAFVLFASFLVVWTASAQIDFDQTWERSGTPVYELDPRGRLNIVFYPTVMQAGGQYQLFHTRADGTGSVIIGSSSGDLQSGWTAAAQGPLLTATESWEQYMGGPFVLMEDDGTYRMWYTTENRGGGSIGLAESPDGVTWTKHSSPVLEPSWRQWEGALVGYPYVLKMDGIYHMWYGGWVRGYSKSSIGYATSTDGITWDKQGSALVEEGYWVARPVVLVEDGVFHMWYVGWQTDGGKGNIYYRQSADGITWETNPDGHEPVISVDSGWQSVELAPLNIFKQPDGSYALVYLGIGGRSTPHSIGIATLAGVATDVESHTPQSFRLSQNYPNPFNPSTRIQFELDAASTVRLAVMDVMGREVAVLRDGMLSSGSHEVQFDAKRLPSGAYLYRLTTPQGSTSRTMLLAK